MFIVAGLISAIIFVALGYFAFWTAMRQGTSADIAKFGKIMGIVLLCLGGIVLILGVTTGSFMGHMMGGGMFPYPFRGWGIGRMGMTRATVEDITRDIKELNTKTDDLEQRLNEIPVFIQDLVKQNLERMKKEEKK
jgi:hypothetical protein